MPLMSLNVVDTNPAVQMVWLITFSITSQPTNRYAVHTEIIQSNGETFLPVPGISIDLGTQQGGTEDNPIKIEVPILPPLQDITTSAAPQVYVTVESMKLGDDATRRVEFYGYISRATRNHLNRSDVLRLEIAGLKELLSSVPLGIQCNSRCIWAFGDQNCGIALQPLQKSGTLVIEYRNRVLFLGSFSPAPPSGYYFRGNIERMGIKIDIRDDPGVIVPGGIRLFLDEAPPKSWNNMSVLLTPGCDKTHTTCQAKYQNIGQFMGVGIRMPDHHPVVETG